MFDWLTTLVEEAGYLGIMLLMLCENVFPPIPSEIIMPVAGFAAAQGKLSLIGVIGAGTIGSLLGAIVWYRIGYAVGLKRLKRLATRHGRWLTLSPEDLDRAHAWFSRHGGVAVFVGRLIPAVRSLISVPAGIARMSAPRFLIWTALGTALWTALLAGAGYLLESEYERVGAYLNPVSNIVFGVLAASYVIRVITSRPNVPGASMHARDRDPAE